MTSDAKPIMASGPIFGLLSIASPIVGGILSALLFGAFYYIGPIVLLALLLVPLSPICGVIFAALALVRREKYSVLPAVGMLINLAVISGLGYFAFRAFSGQIDLFKGCSWG